MCQYYDWSKHLKIHVYKDLIAGNIENDSSKVCQLSFSNEIGCVTQEVETRIPTNTNIMF